MTLKTTPPPRPGRRRFLGGAAEVLLPTLPGLLIAAFASVQFWDAMTLLEGSLPRPLLGMQERTTGSTTKDSEPSADLILEQNPFDSKSHAQTPVEASRRAPPGTDPLRVKPCAGIRVFLVTEAPDPEQSIALVRNGEGSDPAFLRVGDVIGEDEGGELSVQYIGFNARRNSPAVWASRAGELCQALLFGRTTTQPDAPGPTARTQSRWTPPEERLRRLAASVGSGIKRVGDGKFEVQRAAVDEMLSHPAELSRWFRIVGRPGSEPTSAAISVSRFKPGSLPHRLGLRSGDRIQTINGFPVGDPEQALRAYAHLRSATVLDVDLLRRGRPRKLRFQIH